MFADTLLAWYEDNRRTLPWRGESDPYKIWVSEIILQQTRVQQGWDYYLRFIEAFPTVGALARAPEEQVLRVWQGLGYYSRARNMHAAAQQIMQVHQGTFPNRYEDIRALKGIGDYTAAAIASIAFHLPHPAVDGNVLRICSRIFGVCDDIMLPATRKQITEICAKHIPKDDPGTFNQACMEFGALWCTPKNPKCDACPFRSTCYALKHGLTETLPLKSKSKDKRDRYFHFTFYLYKHLTVLEKRSGQDIWRNLYQFPLLESPTKPTCHGNDKSPVLELKETLSHQIIHGFFYLKKAKKQPKLTDNQILVDIDNIRDYPMPKIMTQFVERVLDPDSTTEYTLKHLTK